MALVIFLEKLKANHYKMYILFLNLKKLHISQRIERKHVHSLLFGQLRRWRSWWRILYKCGEGLQKRCSCKPMVAHWFNATVSCHTFRMITICTVCTELLYPRTRCQTSHAHKQGGEGYSWCGICGGWFLSPFCSKYTWYIYGRLNLLLLVSDYKHFGAMCILLGFSLGCIKLSLRSILDNVSFFAS